MHIQNLIIAIIFCINITALVLSIFTFSKRNEHFNKIKYTTATSTKSETFTNVSLYVIGGNINDIRPPWGGRSSKNIIQLNFNPGTKNNILQDSNVGQSWTSNKYNLSWNTLSNTLPTPRFFAMATSVKTPALPSNPYVMLIGGVPPASGLSPRLANVLVWPGPGYQWLKGFTPPFKAPWGPVPQLSTSPIQGSIVTYNKPSWRSETNEFVFVIGGRHDQQQLFKTISYLNSQPSQGWKWESSTLSLQQGRQGASVGISYVPYYRKGSPNNDYIVVMGGQSLQGGLKFNNSIEVFSLNKDGIIQKQSIYYSIFSDSSTSVKPSSNSLIFLVKGPPRKDSQESTSLSTDAAITYIVAIPLKQSGQFYLYDIPLEDVINKKLTWVRSQLSMYSGGTKTPTKTPTKSPNLWPLYYSCTENITKYFYGSADPIGKYININGSKVWCDDYCKPGQHNYIFIGGGSTLSDRTNYSALINICGILDIQINNDNNDSVFTSSYYEGGPNLNMPNNRGCASSAIIAS